MRHASEIPLNLPLSRETSGAVENRKPRLRLVKAVNELKEARAVPKSFAQALENLRTERKIQTKESKEIEFSGVESVEGLESLGLDAKEVEELLGCLPGNKLREVRFSEKVNLVPDPTREGKKVFSSISKNKEGDVEVNLYSSSNYGGGERERGFLTDEFSSELVRAYARANEMPKKIRLIFENKLFSNFSSEKILEEMVKVWDILVGSAVHIPMAADWSSAYAIELPELLDKYDIAEKDAWEITRLMQEYFQKDPNQFVLVFQEKERKLKKTIRLFELSETVAKAPINSFFTRNLHDPKALTRFATTVKGKVTDFHIENERAVLARCAELALNVAYACQEAEFDGDNFPAAMGLVSTHARSLGSEWGKLLSKRKEISDVLVQAWHQAMSDYKK